MQLSQFTSLFGFFAFSGLNLVCAEGVKFQLKFEPEKSYFTKTTVEQSADMMMGGKDVKSAVKMEMTTEQKAAAAAEGVEVKQSMSALKMSMDVGGMAMSFDSENPEGALAGMFKPLLDAESTTLYSNEGEILKIETPAVAGMENLGMGKDELEQSIRELSNMMPNRVIQVGESWTSKSQLSMGGITKDPVEVVYTLNFESLEEREGVEVAKVQIKGKIEDGDDNIQVTSKKLEGVMYFDGELGQPREWTVEMNLKIGLPEGVPVAGGAKGDMEMDVISTSKLIAVK